jgi:hypothetical protein
MIYISLSGDLSNLVGCILTHQLPFQTYLAAYFCLVDFSLVAQYLYYYKPPPSLPPSEEASPLSASTPLLEEGLAHSVTEGYGTTRSRRYSGVSASYPPPGLLPGSDDTLNIARANNRSQSRARALSLSKRATLRELKTTAANIAQTADSLLYQQRSHRRPRSASYAGYSRPPDPHALTGTGTTADTLQSREPKGDAEDDGVNPLVESFYSEAGGSHPRHRPITLTWTTTHPHSSLQPQPIEIEHQREVVNEADEADDTTSNGEGTSAGLRQRSRSRGRATTRYRFGITPLDTVPGSYVKNPTETTPSEIEGRAVNLSPPRASVSGRRASGKRSAGIVFLSVGVGALFAFGTQTDASNQVGERRASAVDKGKGRVLGVRYTLSDEETGAKSNDHADAQIPPVHLFYPDTNDEKMPPPYHRYQRPERTKQEMRWIIGRISAWTCTTLYLTSRLPQIWKNVRASRPRHPFNPDT